MKIIFYFKAWSHCDLILDNKLWHMVLSVDITKNCRLIYKKELKQREYLYNEVIPTAWLPDSIPQVILPCANLTLYTTRKKSTSNTSWLKIHGWNLFKCKKLDKRKFQIIFLLNMQRYNSKNGNIMSRWRGGKEKKRKVIVPVSELLSSWTIAASKSFN